MINPNFDPKRDHPDYYYLDGNGCPLYSKEDIEAILKKEKEMEVEIEVPRD